MDSFVEEVMIRLTPCTKWGAAHGALEWKWHGRAQAEVTPGLTSSSLPEPRGASSWEYTGARE